MTSMGYYRPNKAIPQDLADRLAPRIKKRIKRTKGCWIRTVCVNPRTGCSDISVVVDGKKQYYYAHRIMYVHKFGPIPDGLTIDHTCEQPACCNPRHLRAISHRDNVLRSKTNPTAINARRDKCIRGHEFTLMADGSRRCHQCRREYAANRYAARRSEG